jgi:hypothetical protein
MNHGDFVNLYDKRFKERNGRYVIKSVATGFGVNGGRQNIELYAKV